MNLLTLLHLRFQCHFRQLSRGFFEQNIEIISEIWTVLNPDKTPSNCAGFAYVDMHDPTIAHDCCKLNVECGWIIPHEWRWILKGKLEACTEKRSGFGARTLLLFRTENISQAQSMDSDRSVALWCRNGWRMRPTLAYIRADTILNCTILKTVPSSGMPYKIPTCTFLSIER